MAMDCKLIVSVTLLKGGKALLVKYQDAPDQQVGWFLPNDLLKQYENPERATARIVSEQLSGLKINPRFSHFESFKGQDGTWHLVTHFTAEIEREPPFSPGENVSESRWFDLDQLPPKEEVAHHGWALDVLSKCLERLPRG